MVGIEIYSSPIRVYKRKHNATIDGLQLPQGWPDYTINKDVHPNASKPRIPSLGIDKGQTEARW
jgi:hypothetical protein